MDSPITNVKQWPTGSLLWVRYNDVWYPGTALLLGEQQQELTEEDEETLLIRPSILGMEVPRDDCAAADEILLEKGRQVVVFLDGSASICPLSDMEDFQLDEERLAHSNVTDVAELARSHFAQLQQYQQQQEELEQDALLLNPQAEGDGESLVQSLESLAVERLSRAAKRPREQTFDEDFAPSPRSNRYSRQPFTPTKASSITDGSAAQEFLLQLPHSTAERAAAEAAQLAHGLATKQFMSKEEGDSAIVLPLSYPVMRHAATCAKRLRLALLLAEKCCETMPEIQERALVGRKEMDMALANWEHPDVIQQRLMEWTRQLPQNNSGMNHRHRRLFPRHGAVDWNLRPAERDAEALGMVGGDNMSDGPFLGNSKGLLSDDYQQPQGDVVRSLWRHRLKHSQNQLTPRERRKYRMGKGRAATGLASPPPPNTTEVMRHWRLHRAAQLRARPEDESNEALPNTGTAGSIGISPPGLVRRSAWNHTQRALHSKAAARIQHYAQSLSLPIPSTRQMGGVGATQQLHSLSDFSLCPVDEEELSQQLALRSVAPSVSLEEEFPDEEDSLATIGLAPSVLHSRLPSSVIPLDEVDSDVFSVHKRSTRTSNAAQGKGAQAWPQSSWNIPSLVNSHETTMQSLYSQAIGTPYRSIGMSPSGGFSSQHDRTRQIAAATLPELFAHGVSPWEREATLLIEEALQRHLARAQQILGLEEDTTDHKTREEAQKICDLLGKEGVLEAVGSKLSKRALQVRQKHLKLPSALVPSTHSLLGSVEDKRRLMAGVDGWLAQQLVKHESAETLRST